MVTNKYGLFSRVCGNSVRR